MNTTTNTLYLVRHGENRANRTREFSHKLVDYLVTTIRGFSHSADRSEVTVSKHTCYPSNGGANKVDKHMRKGINCPKAISTTDHMEISKAELSDE